MKADSEEEAAELEAAFEQSIFIHDRDLWKAVYSKDEEEALEEDIEFIVPSENPEEFAEMMAEMRSLGLIKN